MSKLNHTPGPWFPAKFYGPGEVRRVVGPNNEQIGSFNETPDAILAAAAPDMLKLLNRVECHLSIELQDEIRAIRAKIKGEE